MIKLLSYCTFHSHALIVLLIFIHFVYVHVHVHVLSKNNTAYRFTYVYIVYVYVIYNKSFRCCTCHAHVLIECSTCISLENVQQSLRLAVFVGVSPRPSGHAPLPGQHREQ